MELPPAPVPLSAFCIFQKYAVCHWMALVLLVVPVGQEQECHCWGLWNTSKAASTLGYLKRLLGALGKWRRGIESALEGNFKRIRLWMPVDPLARDWVCFRGKLQENQTVDASQSLGLYILSYCMYMLSNLLILFRAGIAEINNMMQPHDSGRMEEKHRTCVMCMCVVA